LNPMSVDPWRRTLPSWGIREGFFALPEPGGAALIRVGAVGIGVLAGVRRHRRDDAL